MNGPWTFEIGWHHHIAPNCATGCCDDTGRRCPCGGWQHWQAIGNKDHVYQCELCGGDEPVPEPPPAVTVAAHAVQEWRRSPAPEPARDGSDGYRRTVRARRLLAGLGYGDLNAVADALQSLQFYKQRCEALQRYQRLLPEPYRTRVCNILANGRAEPFGDES